MALLTDRTLAQSSAITPTTLIHIVTTADTSQNFAGSSYKAELGQLTSLFSGGSDTYVTGFTYTANTFTIYDNSGNTFPVTIDEVTGLTINGDLIATGNTTLDGLTATTISANTFSATTIGASGNCVTDLYVSNINSCSPLNIQPTSTGNVLIGTGGTVNVGVGISSPTAKLHINNTGSTNTVLFEDDTNPDSTPFVITNAGDVGAGTLSPTAKLHINTSAGTTSLLKLTTDNFPYNLGEINYNGTGVALGGSASVTITSNQYSRGLALGFFATTNTDESGVAVGHYCSATSGFRDAIAIGVAAKAQGAYSMAIGNLVSATTQSIMIGLGLWSTGGGFITNNVSNSIAFGLNSDTPTMWVTGGNSTPGSSGNVGINTSTPSEKLDVSGKTKTISLQVTSGATNGYVLTSDSSGNGTWQPLSSISGSSVISVTAITTSAYTATTSFAYYGVEYTGNTSIQIPNATGIDGFTLRVKDERGTAATYPITITPATGNIDGNPSVTIAINYMSLTMVARNNNWWII